MGLVQSCQPGSIRSVHDMGRALRIVFEDLFHDVLFDGSSGPDAINLDIDNGNDEDSLSLVLTIRTEEEVRAGREQSRREVIGIGWTTWERIQGLGLSEADRRLAHPALTDDERHVVTLFQSLDIPRDLAARRLMGIESASAGTDDEARLVAAFRALGIPFRVAVRRLEDESLDEGPAAEASARCCEPGEGCRFGWRKLFGLA